jgi:hemerythrin superfamily protein
MDVLQFLKKDHKMVKELFAECANLAEDDTQNKPVLVVQICQALTVHTQVEEELFYPALYQVRSKDLTVLLDEAAEEHQVLRRDSRPIGYTSQEARLLRRSLWGKVLPFEGRRARDV